LPAGRPPAGLPCLLPGTNQAGLRASRGDLTAISSHNESFAVSMKHPRRPYDPKAPRKRKCNTCMHPERVRIEKPPGRRRESRFSQQEVWLEPSEPVAAPTKSYSPGRPRRLERRPGAACEPGRKGCSREYERVGLSRNHALAANAAARGKLCRRNAKEILTFGLNLTFGKGSAIHGRTSYSGLVSRLSRARPLVERHGTGI
jgi:hypothetical protein